MSVVMSSLRKMAERAGAAVIVIHHQRKSNGFKGRAGENLRGSSAIEAAVDLAIHIDREPQSNDIKCTSTKNRLAPVDPFAASLNYTHKKGTREFATLHFIGLDVAEISTEASIKATIFDTVRTSPGILKTPLIDAVKSQFVDVGINRIRSMVAEMVREGDIISRDGAGRAKQFYMPDPFDMAMK